MSKKLSKSESQKGYGLVAGLVSLVFGIIVVTLVLRLIFRLLGANPDAGFTYWLYGFTAPLISPFTGIFNENSLNLATGHLEISTLVALLVYGLIGGVLERATSWGPHRTV